MGEHNLQFAALVGSRICHDLISPIGAINNGMELMSMSGISSSPEMALISESVDAANARIRFFRIAYGAPSDTQLLGPKEVTSIMRDCLRGSRLSLDWEPSEDIARSEVQLVFLAFQCAEQALPYGGDITIKRITGRWEFELTAERMLFDPKLWDSLADIQPNSSETMPAHVQFLLLPLHAAAKGRRVEWVQRDGSARLTV
jgi:histidine phosphotransferase ChpT